MLSLILPFYNPPKDWHTNLIEKYCELSKLIPETIELILVNDGSIENDDNTILNKIKNSIHNVQIITYKENQGKGFALRTGVGQANGTKIIYTDIDFPYTNKSFLALYDSLVSGTDIAVGIKNADYYSHLPFIRRFISKTLQLLIRYLLSMRISDTQCGLKGFKASHKNLFLNTKINQYLFDLEFIHLCFKQKQLNIVAIPLQLNSGVIFRKMNYKIILKETKNFINILLRNQIT